MRSGRMFITGATKGIGRSIAKHFTENGWQVTGTTRNTNDIKDPVPGVTYVDLELSDPSNLESVKELVEQADVLINNAGISQTGALTAIDHDNFQKCIQVNFLSPVVLSRYFMDASYPKKKGILVHIGSLASQFPLPYYTSYVSSKCALLGFSLSLFHEARRRNIQVTLIDPHDIKTSIAPVPFTDQHEAWKSDTLHMVGQVQKKMKFGSDPDVVVEAVQRVVARTDRRPYIPVGKRAGLLVLLSRWLPKSLVLRLIRKSYALDGYTKP